MTGLLEGGPLAQIDSYVLVYFLAVNSFYALLLLSAAWEMRRHLLTIRAENRWRVLQSELVPTISLLAAAYNEMETIGDSVQAMLGLYYPNLEVVVINDGSTDATIDVLVERFQLLSIDPLLRRVVASKPVVGLYRSRLHPNLVVLDKENGGKADALNAGLNAATGRLVCSLDADTLIEPDALQRMVRPFISKDDTLAAGGAIRVANGSKIRDGRVVSTRVPRQAITGFQVIEYLRAFLFGRLGWNRLGGNLIISGAFGLFDREAILAAGGYAHDTVGEDIELVVHLRRQAAETGRQGRVEFIPDPVAWTEAPASLSVLARQRDRWHRGLSDVLWRHRRLFLNPRYKALGLVVYPYFLFFELLAPVIEAVGLVVLVLALIVGSVDLSFAALFFLVAYGYGLCLTILTLVLEEMSFHRYETISDRLVLMGWGVAENFGYRQLTVIWRLRGLVKFLGKRKEWGVMDRKGFAGSKSH